MQMPKMPKVPVTDGLTYPEIFVGAVAAPFIRMGGSYVTSVVPNIPYPAAVTGIVEMAGGFVAHKFLDGGLVGNGLAIGATVAGMEDLVSALIPQVQGIASGMTQGKTVNTDPFSWL